LLNYLEGQFEQSVRYWVKLKKLSPHDWQLRAKLIQTYEANGQKKKRDQEINELRDLHDNGKNPKLTKSKFFIRDQFMVGNIRVFVFDYYNMDAEWHMGPLAWKFDLTKDGKAIDGFISLGSYDSITQLARASNAIKPNERVYHLDGYWGDGTHLTYGIYHKKPDYDWTKEKVVAILENKLEAITSATPVSSIGAKKEGQEEKE
jgi:hypothetical protein